jgi:hypothetical protein
MPLGRANILSVRGVVRGENSSLKRGWTKSCEGFQGQYVLRPLRGRMGSVQAFLMPRLIQKRVNGRLAGRDSEDAGESKLLLEQRVGKGYIQTPRYLRY